MDTLELILTEVWDPSGHNFDSIKILVNGKDFLEMVKEYELPFAKKEGKEDIAGSYDFLSVSDMYYSLISYKEKLRRKRERFPILECQCHWEGCWDLEVRINQEGNKIIWLDFRQGHRDKDSDNHWDYKKFGKFVFDKENYDSELKKFYKTKDLHGFEIIKFKPKRN